MSLPAVAVARLLFSFVRHAFCALRGHEMTLHFAPGRLSLRCMLCGAETPGWRLDLGRNVPRLQRCVATRATARLETATSRSLFRHHHPEPASPAAKAA